jgi:hypothetical protein
MSSSWWDWSHEQLRERIEDLTDIKRFLEKYG